MIRTACTAAVLFAAVAFVHGQQSVPASVTARGEWSADARQGWTNDLGRHLQLMRIHRVTSEFIRELNALGFRSLLSGDLIRMRIHHVDAEFIRQLQADGYQNLSVGDVIDIAVRGPRFARVRKQ